MASPGDVSRRHHSHQRNGSSLKRSSLSRSMFDLFSHQNIVQGEELLRDLIHCQKDKTDAVAAHTQKGIEFLERIGTYAKERAQIEEEYAAKLKSLAKKSLGKKKEDEEAARSFTCVRSFANLLRELESLAAQHEVVAERLRNEVLPFTASKANEHRGSRKQCLGNLQQINANLNAAIDHLNKQQRSYGKSFKEAEAAYGKYYKAEKNMEISRLDLEKSKTNALMRNQLSEEAKHSYAHALQGANDAQDQHYGKLLPDALERMRQIDMDRIMDTRQAMDLCISADTEVHTIIARCHEDMRRAVEQMEPEKDTTMVVEQYKTGYLRPPPYQFEDLGSPDGTSTGMHAGEVDSTLKRGMLSGVRKDSKSVVRNKSMKIFGGGGDKHKVESNGDYGQLPPQQRIRRLAAKIGELEKEREKTQQSREGLARMQQVYRDNPKMGNAGDCERDLKQYDKEVDALTQQITKFRILLDDAQAQNNLPLGSTADTPPSVRSGSSASSVPPPKSAQSNGRSSVSEESIASMEGVKPTGGDRREEVYEECALPVLGTALAQFAYDGGTEGTMKMKENDQLLLIEKDEGDGWTRVRTLSGSHEGFVPSSYLKCSWYPNE